ncbi:HIT family protein [Falsibacillus albus]|nr:HIT family protein [Falsibacillus albus]
MKCLGCHLANKNEPVFVVYEDEFVCCFLDHDPFNEGHTLIVPKKHVRYFYDLDKSTSDSIMKAAGLISNAIKTLFNPDGITICQNGGSFDDLTHFHMHVVPRYEGQNFADFFSMDEAEVKDRAGLSETQRKILEFIFNSASAESNHPSYISE